jgi:hypothetical protein
VPGIIYYILGQFNALIRMSTGKPERVVLSFNVSEITKFPSMFPGEVMCMYNKTPKHPVPFDQGNKASDTQQPLWHCYRLAL